MFKEITACRACGHKRLYTYLDLNDQPLANSYRASKDIVLPRIPLKANLCEKCYHSQLSVVVDPDEMFKHYLYVSGTSNTLKEYFKWFAFLAGQIADYVKNDNAPLRVLDIACNDGSQLDAFKARGWETYGNDPAENLLPTARQKGHKVLGGYWNHDTVANFNANGVEDFDIITAQNVFAHVDDALGFLETCKEVMHDKTVLMIQTSQCDMFVNGEFDTMYHEHLSFFTVSSMKALAERAGLHFERVFKTAIHGNSYVFMLTKNGGLLENNIDETYNAEFLAGMYNTALYDDFAKNAKKVVSDLEEVIQKYRNESYKIIPIGCAAKAMTVFNFGQFSFDCIVDESPLKIGKFTPGSDIPIVGMDVLTTLPERIVIIPTAWNFWDEIISKVKKIRPDANDIFIKYFPKLKIYDI